MESDNAILFCATLGNIDAMVHCGVTGQAIQAIDLETIVTCRLVCGPTLQIKRQIIIGVSIVSMLYADISEKLHALFDCKTHKKQICMHSRQFKAKHEMQNLKQQNMSHILI